MCDISMNILAALINIIQLLLQILVNHFISTQQFIKSGYGWPWLIITVIYHIIIQEQLTVSLYIISQYKTTINLIQLSHSSLLIIMQQLINSRYKFNSKLYSSTSSVEQAHIARKSSADPQHTTLKLNRLLPKLPTNHKQIYQPITDTQSQRYYAKELLILNRSQPKDTLNFTKINLRQGKKDYQFQDGRYQVISKQGKRSYNEDRYLCVTKLQSPYHQSNIKHHQYQLYAVFDGHGGTDCAEFLKNNFSVLLSRSKSLQNSPEQALKQTFSTIQQKFLTICESKPTLETSGSCAVACLLVDQKIHVANLGDCRALLLSQEGYLQMTHDHKPQDTGERLRILKHGGKIYRDHQQTSKNMKIFKQMRIFPGNLNVSRTFGDAQVKLKKYGGLPGMISSIPDINTFPTRSYQMLLLASDGLFQAFTSEEIYQIYAKKNEETSLKTFIKELSEEAEAKSSDNITIIMIDLLRK